MLKNFRTSLVLVLALGCAGPVLAQADATPHQVYEAVKAGHLDQAHTMINQVLQHHPESAEAHYVAAEVYAREGNLGSARQELATAETIKPGLPFITNRESLSKLQRQLAQGQPMRTAPRFEQRNSQVHSAIPWGFLLVVVGVIAVIWAVMRRRSATAVYQQYPGAGPVVPGGAPGYGGPGPGYGPGYGGGGPGIGSGIAGGLATGLGVGAGLVAGEALAHNFLDRGREGGAPTSEDHPTANPNADSGGNDFGVSDGSSWDDGGGSGGGGDFGGGGDDWT